MHKKSLKKAIALVLAGVMLVSVAGCFGKSEQTDGSGGIAGIWKTDKVEKKELKPESVVVAVGDQEATYKELMVYMYVLKTKYQDVFGDEIWQYQLDNGRTMSSVAIEQVVSMITEMKVISEQASDLGIDLSGDEREDIRRFVQTIYDKAAPEDIESYYLDVDTITEVYCENEIADKVYDSCITGVATNINDSDARQMTVQYIYLQTSGENQSGVEVVLSPETVEKRRKEAKALRKKAKSVDDFLSFAQANTESDEAQITFGKGDMSEAFTLAAMSLASGELSDVVEAPEGFYIIYCVNDNEEELTLQKKEELIAQIQKANFEAQYNEWAGEYEVEVSPLIL